MSKATKPSVPVLRVDTQSTPRAHGLQNSSSNLVSTPTSATSPTFPVPLTPKEVQASPLVHLTKFASFQNTLHAKDESRKLLRLILDQLHDRPKPPPAFEPTTGIQTAGEAGIGQIFGVVKNAVRFNRLRQDSLPHASPSTHEDSDEGDSADTFTTDATFELMVQLKEVLLFSISQGWQIFEASTLGVDYFSSSKLSSPFNIRSSARQSGIGGKHSRSPSPTREKHLSVPDLLSECISVFVSIISEDCRFQTSSPRPSRPSNSLQWVSLDIAQLLVHLNRQEPSVISRITSAMIPALNTFPPEMYPRLLAFFDNVILRGVLEDLRGERGETETYTSKKEHPLDQNEAPTVSIQVVEAPDEEPGGAWKPWNALETIATSRIQSSNAPLQPLPVYHLAAISSPLLAAILETASTKASSPLAVYNFCRLVNTLVTLKKDAYLDILQVVAYHTSESRRSALSLLITFWPTAMGHVVVSKALPIFNFTEMALEKGLVTMRQNATHPYAHNFVPWRFKSNQFAVSQVQHCQSCSNAIRGFGLLCTACMCPVHFDCYDCPDGNVLHEYSAASDGNSGKMVVHRYCLVTQSRLDTEAYTIRKADHIFVLAHIFTLPLCTFCGDPIWGCQALHCTSCRLFVHSSCVTNDSSKLPYCGTIELSSAHMTVPLSKIRQSFTDFYADIFLSLEDLGKQTYEEISVSSATLWTQLQIYNNGLALGSFIISKEDVNTDTQDFELPYLVELYEAYLLSGKLPVSPSLTEYLRANSHQASTHPIMFDWPTLAYIASTVKVPHDVQNHGVGDSRGFLKVDKIGDGVDDDVPQHPYEVVPLGHVRDALGYEFNIFSEGPARHCLSHLHKLGFFCTGPGPFVPMRSTSNSQECYFPLPLGFDLSVDVETLVSAIESCLSDLDLSVNEFGFLLLVRRFQPNGLMSDYALRRLTRVLLSWILSEDVCLASILRDYVSVGRHLPGVRHPSDPVPWPYPRDWRRIPTSSVNNGGDYVAARRALLHTYVVGWLLALHNQDISVYPSIIFDATREFATDYPSSDTCREIAENCLKSIIKLSQASVTFTALDDLFLLWLKSLEYEVLDTASIPALQRLLNKDSDSAARFSTYVDATLTNVDDNGLKLADPWSTVWRFAERPDSLTTGLMWLRLFARSGVEINTLTIAEYNSLMLRKRPTLSQGAILMEAVLISTWLKSTGRQELQPIIAQTVAFFQPAVKSSLQSSSNMSLAATTFVRRSLSICLLLYGCERRLLLSSGMVDKEEVDELPARRRLNARIDMASDPVIVDQHLMATLDEYVRCGNEDVAGLAAKFLHSFMMNSPLLKTYEVDNFVLRNVQVLSSCVWQLYEVQHPSVANVRASLLLRVLVVDAVPFRELLAEMFSSSSPWESRLSGASRLFHIIMDIQRPVFQTEDGRWQLSVLDIFYFFFQLIWLDHKEEIRTAVVTWTETLLPTHLGAIASCWQNALPSLQPPERLRLVAFLHQLQPHFPKWKTLSWKVIIEALLKDEKEDSLTPVRRSSSDQTEFRVALLLLSLQMMESGMEVDVLSCLKLKLHLAKVLGFNDVEAVPTSGGKAFFVRFEQLESIPESCFPCVHAFPRMLDASHDFELPPSVMGSSLVDDDKPCRVLVGAVFVDLVLAVMCSSLDLLSLPVLTLRSLLEALMVIVFKHDFGSMAIKHLDVLLRKALRRTLELLLLEISYELRQLALSVIQTYIKRGTAISGTLAVDCIEKATALIVALKHSEDPLVFQAKTFIEMTLVMLGPSGIFCSLCRRLPNPDFYEVLKSITQARNSLPNEASIDFQEDLLRSITSQPPEIDWQIIHYLAENINMFVEVILCEEVSDSTLRDLATWTVTTARRASGLGVTSNFDHNTLVSLGANLLRFKRVSIRQDLFACVETVFRIALLRSNVRKETISLLFAAASSHESATPSDRSIWVTQSLSRTMVESLDEILRLKVRVTPITLASLIEAILSRQRRGNARDDTLQAAIPTLAQSAIYFLQNHTWAASEADDELTASLAVARFIFYAVDQDYHELSGDTIQSRSDTVIRMWIVLLLAALTGPSTSKHGVLMLSQFDYFLSPYTKTLGMYVQEHVPPPETAAADIEYAYLAMKSWLLLLHKLSIDKVAIDSQGELTRKIWNELWPPFESILNLLSRDGGDEILPLSTAVWSSVANLFVFVLQSRSPIALNSIPCLTLLRSFKESGRRNSALSKLARALDGDVLPELQLEVIISQTTKDTANAEKLRSLDKHSKMVGDRRRVPT
ncbi:hypothetical protein V8B97DRAFT_1868478 [Scleroderma yunnanense]